MEPAEDFDQRNRAPAQTNAASRPVLSRYRSPTPRRASIAADASLQRSEWGKIDEARSVAIQALRALKLEASRRAPAVIASASAQALLNQIREEEDRLVGLRARSRSRSPPLHSTDQRPRRPSPYSRTPSRVGEVFRRGTSSSAAVAESPGLRASQPPPPVASRPQIRPFRVPSPASERGRPSLHFDPLFDSNSALASKIYHWPPPNSELAPFFSSYCAGVRGAVVLPQRYSVPPEECNRRVIISRRRSAERERNNRMKVEHPPRRQWDYWAIQEQKQRRRRAVTPSVTATTDTLPTAGERQG